MTELEERLNFLRQLRQLRELAEAGDLQAGITLRRIERERRKRIETVNGHKIPTGRKGDSIFLNRKKRRERFGL